MNDNVDAHRTRRRRFSLMKLFPMIFIFIILSTSLMAFSRRRLEMAIQGASMSLDYIFVIDTTGAIVSACFMPLVAYIFYHNPISKYPWRHSIKRYLSVITIYIALFVGVSSLLKYAGFILHELAMPSREVWVEVIQSEMSGQVFMLIIIAMIVNIIYSEQIRLIKTQQNLAQERLQSLQNQLNPHFLFNTLNMISAMMYQDVEAADRMIERLSELLRASLMLGNSVEITIGEELALLNAYASIMQERFPNTFEINVRCDSDLRSLFIPPLLLQPLVENCIKHGQFDARHPTQERGQVEVRIRERGHLLELSVLDNGDAHLKSSSEEPLRRLEHTREVRQDEQITLMSDTSPRDPTSNQHQQRGPSGGVGLKVTKDRLRLLYGREAHIHFGFRGDQPGYQVKVTLPLLTAQRGAGLVRAEPTPSPSERSWGSMIKGS